MRRALGSVAVVLALTVAFLPSMVARAAVVDLFAASSGYATSVTSFGPSGCTSTTPTPYGWASTVFDSSDATGILCTYGGTNPNFSISLSLPFTVRFVRLLGEISGTSTPTLVKMDTGGGTCLWANDPAATGLCSVAATYNSGGRWTGAFDTGVIPVNQVAGISTFVLTVFGVGAAGTPAIRLDSWEAYSDSPNDPVPGAGFRWVSVRAGTYNTSTKILSDLYLEAAGVPLCGIVLVHEDVDYPNQYGLVVPPSGDQLGDLEGLHHYTNLNLSSGGSGWYHVSCEAGSTGHVIVHRFFVGGIVASGTPVPTPTAPPPGTIIGGEEVCQFGDLVCVGHNIVNGILGGLGALLEFLFVPSDDVVTRMEDANDEFMDHEPMYFLSLAFSYVQPLVEFFWGFMEAEDLDSPHEFCYSADIPLWRGGGWLSEAHEDVYYDSSVNEAAFCIAPGEVVGGDEGYYHVNIRPLLGYAVYIGAVFMGLRRFMPHLTIGG